MTRFHREITLPTGIEYPPGSGQFHHTAIVGPFNVAAQTRFHTTSPASIDHELASRLTLRENYDQATPEEREKMDAPDPLTEAEAERAKSHRQARGIHVALSRVVRVAPVPPADLIDVLYEQLLDEDLAAIQIACMEVDVEVKRFRDEREARLGSGGGAGSA